MSQHKVALLGVPVDHNSSFLPGASLAPARIREAFHCDSSNMWTELGVDLGNNENWVDAGDVSFADGDRLKTSQKIRATTLELIAEGKRVLSLGGDHSVSFPLIDAHAQSYDGLNILHVDAHGDLYDDFEGNPLSHASPFARLMETGRISRLLQVGIRTLNDHQREQAARFGVEIIEMKDWDDNAQLGFDGPVYLSVDLDGLDPAFAPGVSHHEPGGFSSRQVINLVHCFEGPLVGADIVELNPHRDINNMTAMVAARLAKEIMGRLLVGG
ncbi:agmatinase [Maritalea porphyrae]|uniref:agmatinase n=1 Tax=Maritalea porphyrae TaxID=880732 RepID=UPI0022AE9B63|nr:agmatinase [Maritalea porphyrae]MCZ4271342.1 agmatinase [Maritalea porphyrae]